MFYTIVKDSEHGVEMRQNLVLFLQSFNIYLIRFDMFNPFMTEAIII